MSKKIFLILVFVALIYLLGCTSIENTGCIQKGCCINGICNEEYENQQTCPQDCGSTSIGSEKPINIDDSSKNKDDQKVDTPITPIEGQEIVEIASVQTTNILNATKEGEKKSYRTTTIEIPANRTLVKKAGNIKTVLNGKLKLTEKNDHLIAIAVDSKGNKNLVAEIYYPLYLIGEEIDLSNIKGEYSKSIPQKVILRTNVKNENLSINGVKVYSTNEFSEAIEPRKIESVIESTETMASEKTNTVKINPVNEMNEKWIISKLNENIKKEGLEWIAGKTEISGLSFVERARIFGAGDNPEEKPNTYGVEYYVGGVFRSFEEPNSEVMQQTLNQPKGREYQIEMDFPEDWNWIDDSLFPAEFDWRKVHGENWNTPVRNQVKCGGCWAFAAIGSVEAYINLLTNKHLNVDLSENQMLACSSGGCNGGFSQEGLDYMAKNGLVDETCSPFSGYPPFPDCNSIQLCSDANERKTYIRKYTLPPIASSKISFYTCSLKFRNDRSRCETNIIKYGLMKYGPGVSGLNWMRHAMTLVGWRQRGPDEIVLIFKNSWGGDDRTGYLEYATNIKTANEQAIYRTFFIADQVIVPQKVLGDKNMQVACLDRDRDGYYTWGIGSKPSTCPQGIPEEQDCDDSDPYKTTYLPGSMICKVDRTPKIRINSIEEGNYYEQIKLKVNYSVTNDQNVVECRLLVNGNIVGVDSTRPFDKIEAMPGKGVHDLNVVCITNDGNSYSDTNRIKLTMLSGGSIVEGKGTSNEPYLLDSCVDLQGISDYLDANFKLVKDINCYSTRTWNNSRGFSSIGSNSFRFNGTLDGQGRTISGLYSSSGCGGLFCFVGSRGIIRNLKLSDLNGNGGTAVGGIAGYNYGKISGIEFVGYINGDSYVGGLVGQYFGEISNSLSLVIMNAKTYYIGGIAGANENKIINCQVGGEIIANSATLVGGAVGSNSGEINYSMANVKVKGKETVGGLVGYNYSGRIVKSQAHGEVIGVGSSIGGLVGSARSTIVDSYSTAKVTGGSRVGGLVGYIDCAGDVINSYSSGNVAGVENVGGLVGYMSCNRKVYNSFATGSVDGNINANGFIGLAGLGLDIRNSYCTNASKGCNAGAQLVEPTQLYSKNHAVYNGETLGFGTPNWDFNNTWNENQNGYPTIK